MKRYKWTVLVGVIITAIIILAQSRDDLTNAAQPSTHSRHNLGLAVAWHWLTNISPQPPKRLNADWTTLESSGTGNVLFVSGPLQTSAAVAESEALARWVARGNVLVMLHLPGDKSDLELRRALDIQPLLSLQAPPTDVMRDRITLLPASPSHLLRDVRGIVGLPNPLYPRWATLPLLESQPLPQVSGQNDVTRPYATQWPMGMGRVVLFSQSALFCNGLISHRDNWVLLLNLTDLRSGAGHVWFDEYHQVSRRDTALFSRHGKVILLLMAVQAGLVAVVFVFARRRRFGPITAGFSRPGRSQLEFVSALADLYRRANARKYALARLYEALIRDLTSGRPRSQRPHGADLALSISQQSSLDLHQAEELLSDIHAALEKPDISRRQLMHIARRITDLRKEIRVS